MRCTYRHHLHRIRVIQPLLNEVERMGRLLVPLFMFTRELLSSPSFYISEYLESHRDMYYDGLLAVSR